MGDEVQREFWLHEPTALVWAVEHRDGNVLRVAGPMPAAAADPALLDHLPYRATDSLWVTLNREQFRPLT